MPKPSNTRSRSLPGHSAYGKIYLKRRSNGAITPLGGLPSAAVLKGRQKTVSEGHHWPSPSGAPLSDRGGPFYTTKVYVSSGTPRVQKKIADQGDGYDRIHEGNFYPVILGADLDSVIPDNSSSDSELDKLGATAISICKPTNSPADLAVFLGELLKEGLPSLIGSSLWRQRTDSARKKAASEYLNVQFGWLPVVSELTKLSSAMKRADDILTQYERDAGRVVRRSYRFPLKKDSSETVLSRGVMASTYGVGDAPSNWPNYPLGDVILKVETSKARWFSGAFTYYLPSGYDSRSELARLALLAQNVLGIDLTPDTVWNLTPWSWAVDWFSNTGDVISNISSFARQGLVMRYGYMMEHTITKYTYTFVARPGLTPPPGTQPLVIVRETKKRRPANPFGFGITWDGLSTFQASILAALGITRRSR